MRADRHMPIGRRSGLVITVLVALVAVLAGCGTAKPAAKTSAPAAITTTSGPTTAAATTAAPTTTTAATTTDPSTTTAPSTTSAKAPAKSSAAAPTTAAALPAGNVSGKVVVIDPGHNGANSTHLSTINAPVPDGDGGTKACNTTGTSTNGGYAEHSFNWAVATQVEAMLQAKGITVIMTRPDDNGVGPCVNVRAQIGNNAHAAAVVSIHGDGAAASDHGFFCLTSGLDPAGPAMAAQSTALATTIRNSVVSSGVEPVANYAETNGLGTRTDLAGLNLSTQPTTLCEMGNMRSPIDSAIQTSTTGRTAIATAITNGILTYIGN